MPIKTNAQKDKDRFDRLPKWAQDEITLLRGNVDHWRKLALVGEREDSQVYQSFYPDRKYLDDKHHITFGQFEVHLNDAGALMVHTTRNGLSVLPRASNSICIITEKG